MTESRTPDPSSGDEPTETSGTGAPPPPADAPSTVPAPVAWDSRGNGSAPSPKPARTRRGQILVVVVAIAAALGGAAAARFAFQQGGSLLGSNFAGGEVWNRLPSDARADFERRIKAAAGDIESMSDAAARTQIQTRVQSGMRRLDDATLVRRLTLQTVALGKLDEASCGAFAQASFGGRAPPQAIAVKLIGALTDAELIEWFNMAVLALEAESRKSPDQRSASGAETDAAFERLLGSLDSASLEQIQRGAAATASPTEACAGSRVLYDAVERMPDSDRQLIALADVSL